MVVTGAGHPFALPLRGAVGDAGGGPRVLVTGGAGFVGVPLVRRLLDSGADVAVVDNFSTSSPGRLEEFSPQLRIEAIDITDRAAMRDAVSAFVPTHCVHLAAIHFIPQCRAEPSATVATNILGTQHVIDALREAAPGCRMLLASSADVYRPGVRPHREDAPTQPGNVYGLSKLTSESLLRFAAEDGAVEAVAARFFNVYGPGETNPHLIPEIVSQVKRGMTTLQLGNLAARRDYVFVDDVAAAIIALLDHAPAGSVINVGSGCSYSAQEVVDLIGDILGTELAVTVDPARLRPADRANLQADVGLLQSLVTGACATPLEVGLRRLLRAEGLLGTASRLVRGSASWLSGDHDGVAIPQRRQLDADHAVRPGDGRRSNRQGA
jgi:UDP-glucose 4-epimerase